jgi:hypothetical protein
MSRVLASEHDALDPADYRMEGTVGTVTSAIRLDGVGEIVFVRDGARHSAPARADNAASIERGAEVVVTRVDGGIFQVQRFSDLVKLEEDDNPKAEGGNVS